MIREPTTGGKGRDARAPLIGRDTEMAALDGAARIVETRREAQIVSLIGPAGIGKSRLIQDFVRKYRDVRAPALHVYRGSAQDSGPAFGLFARLLHTRFGLVKGMDREIAREQMRAQVSAVLEDSKVGDVVYFLGQLLGIPCEESPLTRAIGDDPREADLIRRAVFKGFLEADAELHTTCLIFEDLHAAHDDSLALLRYLLEYLSGPILVICAARPELLLRHEDWARAGEARHRVLELPALAEAEASAMMRALLAPCEGGPPAKLVEAACSLAGGSPLLLEQMVRIYVDTGVLEDQSLLSEQPRWQANLEKLASATLPQTVEDAVNARLATLSSDELRLLEQAAAMGSVFWSGAFVILARMGREAPELWTVQPLSPDGPLSAPEAAAGARGAVPASEDGPSVDTAMPPVPVVSGEDAAAITAMLAGLSLRDYILRLPDSSFPGSDEYIFKLAREREAIQKRTRPTALRRYHQGIADWMDHQKALRSGEEYIAMLAEHRDKAGDAIRAGLAYLEAGGVARARYASAKAAEYYEKGLALLGESHVGRRIEALHDYGDVLQLQGRIDDALAAFREMLTLAYRLDLRRKGGAAHNRIGRLYRETGALEEAAKHLATAMVLFEADGDERGVASTIDDIGKLHWLKGEYPQALVALRDGLGRRRKLADRRSIALSLNNLGLVLQDSGQFKEALEALEQSLLIRREIGDRIGVGVTLNNLGTVAQDQRDFTTALALFGEALLVCKQIGDRNRIAMVLTNIGEVHYRSGNPAEAIKILGEAEGLCDDLGDKLGLAEVLRGLGKAYMLKGDLAKARDCIGRAVDLFAAVRSKVHLGIALRTLGEITAAGGWGSAHTRSAREYFARAVTIFEQTGNEVELARTYKVYSRFLQRPGGERPEGGSIADGQQQDAETMNEKADAIFARLQIPLEIGNPTSRRVGTHPE
jgi:tetratricopeptide (TPR) repeat protein